MLLLTYLSIGTWLERFGGLGLILLGFADNSIIPMPGSMDALTIILSAHQKTWWPYYATMATIGGMVGGYATYTLGAKSEAALERKLSKRNAEKIYRIFKRYGFWSLFVPALLPPPAPYSPFLLAAGVLKYPKRNFLIAVGTARGIRYGLLAWLGSIYHKQIFRFFHRYYEPMLWTVIAVGVIGSIAALWWTRKRRREGKPVIPEPKEPRPRTA
ncbi:MAG TPA: VTT domain-containing protein [Candidatus Angelobacter sp.]